METPCRLHVCCRALARLGACFSQLDLSQTRSQPVLIAYATAASLAVAATTRLADMAGMAAEPAAALAGQCADMLLRCGAVALRSQPAHPLDVRLNLLGALLSAIDRAGTLAQHAVLSGSSAAPFLDRVPASRVLDLLQTAAAALSESPAHMQAPGEGRSTAEWQAKVLPGCLHGCAFDQMLATHGATCAPIYPLACMQALATPRTRKRWRACWPPCCPCSEALGTR